MVFFCCPARHYPKRDWELLPGGGGGGGKAARLGPRPDAQLRVWRSSGLHPSLAHCTRGDRREERAKGREKKRTTHVELRERGGVRKEADTSGG
jgi:hypothetical protein